MGQDSIGYSWVAVGEGVRCWTRTRQRGIEGPSNRFTV